MPRARRLMSTIVTQRKRTAGQINGRMDGWIDGRADVCRRNIDVRAVARFRGMRRCSGDACEMQLLTRKEFYGSSFPRETRKRQLSRNLWHVGVLECLSLDFRISKTVKSYEHRNDAQNVILPLLAFRSIPTELLSGYYAPVSYNEKKEREGERETCLHATNDNNL